MTQHAMVQRGGKLTPLQKSVRVATKAASGMCGQRKPADFKPGQQVWAQVWRDKTWARSKETEKASSGQRYKVHTLDNSSTLWRKKCYHKDLRVSSHLEKRGEKWDGPLTRSQKKRLMKLASTK